MSYTKFEFILIKVLVIENHMENEFNFVTTYNEVIWKCKIDNTIISYYMQMLYYASLIIKIAIYFIVI